MKKIKEIVVSLFAFSAISLWITGFILVFLLLEALVLKLLWNWLMPYLFHLPTINIWKALGVSILTGLIFTGIKAKGK